MYRPWLAAGVTCSIIVLLGRELALLARERGDRAAVFASGFPGVRLRGWFRGRMAPVADLFLTIGLTANGVTFSQLGTSIVCDIAYAHGWMFTAGWMLIPCGARDVLGGETARRQGRAEPRGAIIVSGVDRYSGGAVFAGLVAFYREAWMLWGVLAAWAGGFLVSSTRTRTERLGIDCREGLLQRREHYVISGGASMVRGVTAHLNCSMGGRHFLVTLGVCVLASLSNLTALQRARGGLRGLA